MINKKISKSFFITFEGGEGTGKSTQAKILYDHLISNNIETVLTREPGGCEESEAIRQLLVKGSIDKWDSITEALLHNAARREHIKKVIKPSLLDNKVVICDRFTDSTMAYQGQGQGVNQKFLTNLIKEVTENIIPDLTFIFDMDIKNSLTRANKRDKNKNRYEKFNNQFHEKIRTYFLSLVNKDKRYILIDASDSIENIGIIILNKLNKIVT
jgi:dTMP kinase